MVAILVVLTIGVFLLVDAFVRRRSAASAPVRTFAPAFVRESLQKVWLGHPDLSPADFGPRPNRFYDRGHTFMELLPDGTVEVGIDRFLRETMAGFRVVGMLHDGQEVRRGDPIAELRSDGRTARVLSPLDGEVSRVLRPYPDENVEQAIYGIIPQRLSEQIQQMTVGEQAVDWLHSEIGKFREFACRLIPKPAVVGATLADGGMPVDPLTQICTEEQFVSFKNRFGLM